MGVDRFGQLAVFLATLGAQDLELGELRSGLLGLAALQIELPQILVRAEVCRIETESRW